MTAISREPNCVKCGAGTYLEFDRQICVSCGYVQGEGSYLATELLPVTRAVEDILDCGTPLETFEALVAHMERRMASNRSIANKLRADANDAMEQAERHDAEANEFDQLIYAMRQAPIAFTAIADTHPKDGDVKQAPLVSGGVAKQSHKMTPILRR